MATDVEAQPKNFALGTGFWTTPRAASTAIFLVTVVFAAWASYLTSESMYWFRVQSDRVLAGSSDPAMSALVLTVYTGFVKKLMALAIAGMLALLGLGLSLHALRTPTTASGEASGGFKISLSSVSPGVCAFLAATVIVVVVVTTRDSFGAPSSPQEPGGSTTERAR